MAEQQDIIAFFDTIPGAFRPMNTRAVARGAASILEFIKHSDKVFSIPEKQWLCDEVERKNIEWPQLISSQQVNTKKGLIKRFGLYANFFKYNSSKKTIVAGSGRREYIDKEGLFAIGAAISQRHSEGKEFNKTALKAAIHSAIEESAIRRGADETEILSIPVQGPSAKYINRFKERHEIKDITPDMQTDSRFESLCDPIGCYSNFILYYAFHGYSPAHTLYTEDATTVIFAPRMQGQRVVRLCKDSEFAKYLKQIDTLHHLQVNERGDHINEQGIVILKAKAPKHGREAYHHYGLPFAIKVLWLFNAAGHTGPLSLIVATKNLPEGKFLCYAVRGLNVTNDPNRFGYLYFAHNRGSAEVALHWKLNVRNAFVSEINDLYNILEHTVSRTNFKHIYNEFK
jgi:hypothetical protein